MQCAVSFSQRTQQKITKSFMLPFFSKSLFSRFPSNVSFRKRQLLQTLPNEDPDDFNEVAMFLAGRRRLLSILTHLAGSSRCNRAVLYWQRLNKHVWLACLRWLMLTNRNCLITRLPEDKTLVKARASSFSVCLSVALSLPFAFSRSISLSLSRPKSLGRCGSLDWACL